MIHNIDELITKTQYPSGEWHIELTFLPRLNSYIEANIVNFDGLAEILVVDGILRRNSIEVKWIIPFFPFARDDRRNSSLSGQELLLALRLVKDLDAICIDPHSDVSGILRHIPQSSVVEQFAKRGLFEGKPIIAIPDAGAAKKVYSWVDRYDLEVVQCLKKRDPATGKLSGFKVDLDGRRYLDGRNVVIVDDICDGGGTFLGLAKELRAAGAGNMRLAVSHGLFTKGVDKLREAFSSIFTLDYMDSYFPNVVYANTSNLILNGEIV